MPEVSKDGIGFATHTLAAHHTLAPVSALWLARGIYGADAVAKPQQAVFVVRTHSYAASPYCRLLFDGRSRPLSYAQAPYQIHGQF